ncbi:MAG: hypothetical protein GY719_04105 [bacterium]|nr:hypothetical protein [bacterium]
MSNVTNVILAGLNETALMQTAYPAFAAAGLSVAAVVDTGEKLAQIAGAFAGNCVVVVEVNLYPTIQDAVVELAALAPARVVVVLPQNWHDRRDEFATLPNLMGGHTAPVSWAQVVSSLKGQISAHAAPPPVNEAASPPPVTPAPAPAQEEAERIEFELRLPRLRRGPSVRLGLYGARGGVGTTTAALTAARALAGEGQRVALFDAARRGDLHVMVGVEPGEQPVTRDGVTLFLGAPTEELAHDLDAVVVDGSRKRGNFNAEWVAVERPLAENHVRRLVGLAPRTEEKDEGDVTSPKAARRKLPKLPGGRWSLSKLISIEVTE